MQSVPNGSQPQTVRQKLVKDLLLLAAQIHIDEYGHEDYLPGQSGMSQISFFHQAERIWSQAHKEQFPERWAR